MSAIADERWGTLKLLMSMATRADKLCEAGIISEASRHEYVNTIRSEIDSVLDGGKDFTYITHS